MTVRLYDRDVDMLEFSAVVKTCEQREKGYIVTLDQTAFFPEGGGQGADHGTLDGVQVLDAHDVHGEVEHLVSAPLTIGSEGRGLSAQLLAQCDGQIIIPMQPGAESLNAAVAAAVVMWEIARTGM
mgnify:CR=1 FL=1